MGVFDFFKKKKSNSIELEMENSVDIKDIFNDNDNSIAEVEELTADDESNVDNNSNFNYNFIVSNEDEYHNKSSLSEEELDKLIVGELLKVVDNSISFDMMQLAAEDAAKIIGVENIESLTNYLHERVAKPTWIKGRYDGLGEWRMAIENAVLMILFTFNKYGVDELLKIANSNTQNSLKAINLLCKNAEKGIEKEKIIDSIIYIMREFEDDKISKTLDFLSQVRNDQKVEKVLDAYYKKYIYDNNIEGAYDTTINLINVKGEFSKEQLTLLKAIALSDNKLKSYLVLKEDDGEIDLSSVSDDLRLRATLSFYSLHNLDEEINSRLMYLRDNSLDLELRKYLNDILK